MKYCPECGAKLTEGAKFCDKCGAKITEEKQINKKENNTANTTSVNAQPKSKIAAGILGIFLGCLGIHNFYLGYNGKAVAQLLMTVLSCGLLSVVAAIWGLIEGILILTGSLNVDAEGNPLGE